MKFPLPDAALQQHLAILGKTGSGKSTTAKGCVEHIVRTMPGARICVLDPIKSDWWGLTSSADGRYPGLPFHILGGPHGHVPLHPSAGKAIGELVGSGALPLSIVDMADFPPGGLSQFFNDFAPALMRSARGVVYLVLEEAHEFAPKERAGVGAETMAIYNSKKLATAGRSKGIRLVVLTQRTQALHNAVLGSCDTMVAHRLTAPADQEPVKAWLKAHVDKVTFEKVSGSLASLPTGSAWVCSGEAQLAEMIAFPRITTFDNSATPTIGGEQRKVTTAPVDQEKLRAIIGSAVVEAEANDPAALKKRIKELEAKLASRDINAELQAAQADGVKQGIEIGYRAGWGDCVLAAKRSLEGMSPPAAPSAGIVHRQEPFVPAPIPKVAEVVTAPDGRAGKVTASVSLMPLVGKPAEGITGPQQRILDALAWWRAAGIAEPERVQVATVARYSATSTSFTNPLSALRTAGLIEYTSGRPTLTAAGVAVARAPASAPTTADLHARIFEILDGPRRRILEPLLRAYPAAMTRDTLASASNYSATSTSFTNPLSGLRSLGLIDYRPGGHVVALPIMFVE